MLYIVATTICIIIQFIMMYFFVFSGSCDNWEKGIGNSRLRNDIQTECKIFVPSYCELSIRDGWFDINRFTQECGDYQMTVNMESFNKRLQSRTNVKRIGYPRVENYPNIASYDEDYFANQVKSDIIDMDDPEVPQSVKDNIEFIIDVSHEKSHIIHVELKKNHTRAEEAKQIRNKVLEQDKTNGNNQRIDKDVLIIYTDNISRVHFHRKMKKLDKWLNQYAEGVFVEEIKTPKESSGKSSKTQNMKAFEYFRYHSVAPYTSPKVLLVNWITNQ